MGNAQLNSILAKKLTTFIPLAPNELQWLAEVQSNPLMVERGTELAHQGQTGHKAFIIQAGWARSYKDLANGHRQIISFPIAGDCVGLRTILLRTAAHSFSALTDLVVSPLERKHILRCVTDFPSLAAGLLWAASRDEAMVVEHLVSVGRRSAIERTAHFFMELAERLNLVGLAKGTEFECPLTQYDLADALGLSAIHVNRVLRQLRERELLTVHGGNVTIHDLNGLRKLSGFQGGYLNSRD